MAASVDYHQQQQFGGLPHRRPLPSGAQPFANVNDPFAHSRTRTVSSNQYVSAMSSQLQAQQQTSSQPARRTLSNATTSTASTANSNSIPANLQRVTTANTSAASSYASSIRRSTSSRSNTPPTSYVALMRKQKATVWCDRAQHEDPRLMAQQRAAKMRATQEVVGGISATGNNNRGTTSSSGGLAGGVRSKIRHHGAPKASAYSAAGNLSGAGVPMRLSASEVDEENSAEEDDKNPYGSKYHQRNGSGRSSLGSNHRAQSSYFAQQQQQQQQQGMGAGRYSNSSTPPSAASYSSSPVERKMPHKQFSYHEDETPMPENSSQRNDYFAQPAGATRTMASGGSSGSSEERGFGEAAGLPVRGSRLEVPGMEGGKSSEELRRRGSVDDRTMTMSGVRLFVANPDLSD